MNPKPTVRGLGVWPAEQLELRATFDWRTQDKNIKIGYFLQQKEYC